MTPGSAGYPADDAFASVVADVDALVIRHERQWSKALEEARRRNEAVVVDSILFARGLMTRIAGRLRRVGVVADPAAVNDAIEATVIDDVHLAIACEARSEMAWAILVRSVLPTVRAVLSRRGLGAAEVEELSGDLLGYLWLGAGPDGSVSRFAAYEGSGSLVSWLVVIVQRRALDRRRERKTDSLDALDDRSQYSGAKRTERRSHEPPYRIVQQEIVEGVDRAVDAAWRGMSPLERLVVRSRFVLGLPQRTIAGSLEVGEPRVSSLLKRAVGRLRSALERRLGEDASLDEHDTALGEALRERLSRISASSVDDARPEGDEP